MMNWLYYLLEANLYLAVFYGFYRLFLHKETFYSLNRFYLIMATLVAFSIPFLQMGYLNNLFGRQQYVYTVVIQSAQIAKKDLSFTSNDLIIYSYLIIAAAFTIKMAYSIYKIIALSLNAKKQRAGSITYVELPHSDTAFSFFNLLFLNPAVSAKNTILKHEMVHIQQKHSLDIIFFEIIQIIAWFNPATYFIKKDIKLLHEYIADDVTTNTDIHKHEYAMFLIQNSFGIVPNQLTNQIFNQSILKRRINMLNKEKSTGRARLKLLFALPIAGGMLCASTMAFTKDYAMIDLYPEKYESAKAVNQEPVKKNTAVKKVKLKEPGKTKSDKLEEVRITTAPPPEPKSKVVKFPPPKVEKVKFPPPIVKPDGSKKKASGKVVKFPPPIVKPDNPPVPVAPPPPPVEPKEGKGDEVTFTAVPAGTVKGEFVSVAKGQTISLKAKQAEPANSDPTQIKLIGKSKVSIKGEVIDNGTVNTKSKSGN